MTAHERWPDSADDITASMAEIYDAYYRSSDYRRRYPKPNRATLDLLFDCGATRAGHILDFGCGNGRYTVPLLQRTGARVTGFDISEGAIEELTATLRDSPWESRATLLCGDAAQLDGGGPYDLVVLLFGVLSHILDRADRIGTLKRLRRLIHPEGRLILTVPNLFRRRPLDVMQAAIRRAAGTAIRSEAQPGNIAFKRRIASAERKLYYHLYSVRGVRRELREAGFAVRTLAPESLLPEWLVTQSDLVGAVDAALVPLLPASLGYCISVVADPA